MPCKTYSQPPLTFELYMQAFLRHFMFSIALSLWPQVTWSVQKLRSCAKFVVIAAQTGHYMDHFQITSVV
jgi:hypothetical protein